MWRKKKEYDELDTRSLIVNKEEKEFRGVGWVFFVILALAVIELYKS